MSYRNEFKEAKAGVRWSFWRGLPLFMTIIVVLALFFGGLRAFGVIGQTIVEREVFKQSYQRSSSFEARIANDEATISEINMQLMNPNLDENTVFNLNAQLSAARVRLAAARRLK